MIEVDGFIGGERVCRILDRFFAGRPLPEAVILDDGPEFVGNALNAWAEQHGLGCLLSSRRSPFKMRLLGVSMGSFEMSV